MPFSANYALSRYGGISYGVRGPAVYAFSQSESITGNGFSGSALFRPHHKFDVDEEGRDAELIQEKRAGAADAKDPAKVKSDSRKITADTDARSSAVKDRRNFKV